MFVFAWTLLPIGFLAMIVIFQKYQSVAYYLSLISQAGLAFALFASVAQRQHAMRDSRLQYVTSVLCLTLFVTIVCFWLGDSWWWMASVWTIGLVPFMYHGIQRFATWNAPILAIEWPNSQPLPFDEALTGWKIESYLLRRGVVATLEGSNVVCLRGVINEVGSELWLELLCPEMEMPDLKTLGIDFSSLSSGVNGKKMMESE